MSLHCDCAAADYKAFKEGAWGFFEKAAAAGYVIFRKTPIDKTKASDFEYSFLYLPSLSRDPPAQAGVPARGGEVTLSLIVKR